MSNRQVVERFLEAMAADDLDTQDALIHDDYVVRNPQSGEVIRGRANRRAIFENYPGSEGGGPSWELSLLVGSGDEFTATGTVTYPDGGTWHFVTLLTVRDGMIWRQIDYFAEPFEAPAWRQPYLDTEAESV
jgi:ketosteroid isomerase-like protein